jgi:hypothetical protein
MTYTYGVPINQHPQLITPPDTTVLWRYMDFARFVQMLETQSLWFSRMDQLDDPLEACFTDAEIEYLRSQAPPPGNPGRSMHETFVGMSHFMRVTTYLNCWRAGAKESLAMWDLYGKGSGIVAVKTTVEQLRNELNSIDTRMFLGQVRYVDWNSAPWDNNSLVMCARKDSCYEHESEVRAIIWEDSTLSSTALFPQEETVMKPFDQRTVIDPPFGINIPINLSRMITEVVIGPRERPWIFGLVTNVLTRYNFHVPIVVSDRLKPR